VEIAVGDAEKEAGNNYGAAFGADISDAVQCRADG